MRQKCYWHGMYKYVALADCVLPFPTSLTGNKYIIVFGNPYARFT